MLTRHNFCYWFLNLAALVSTFFSFTVIMHSLLSFGTRIQWDEPELKCWNDKFLTRHEFSRTVDQFWFIRRFHKCIIVESIQFFKIVGFSLPSDLMLRTEKIVISKKKITEISSKDTEIMTCCTVSFQESSLASFQPEISATFTKTTAAKRIPTTAFQVNITTELLMLCF